MIPLPWGKDINFMNNLLDRDTFPLIRKHYRVTAAAFASEKKYLKKSGISMKFTEKVIMKKSIFATEQ